MTVKIPDSFLGKPIKGSMERILVDAPISTTNPIAPNSNEKVHVKTIDDYWQISGVEYKGGIHTIDLAKSLLDGGNSHTQEGWVEYTNRVVSSGGFHTGNMELYHSLFTALYRSKDNPTQKTEIEQAKEFIKKQMREKWLMTLTRIKYNPSGNFDEVIHDYGTPISYSKTVDFIGKGGEITANLSPEASKALLGTDKLNEVSDIYRWINGTDTYIWRVNSRPKNQIERVAWFSSNSDRASLICSRSPSDSDASLGVRAAKI